MAAKPAPSYTLSGHITNRQAAPLAGLLVRAFDQDPDSSGVLLGQAATGPSGDYTIRFTAAQFKPAVPGGGPDVFIRVYAGGSLLGQSPRQRNARQRITIDLAVDHRQEKPDASHVLRGRITQPNGNPVAGARVRVVDRSVLAKDDIALAELDTDDAGGYEVKYEPPRGSAADLLVQILDAGGEVVATSPLIIAAAREQSVEVVVDHAAYPDLPEFAQLQQRLKPLLNGAEPAELNSAAVAYLAGKSRVNPVNIAYLVQASRLARETGIAPEAFYGLLRANLPVSLPALVVQDRATQKRALEEAVAANIVSTKVAGDLESVLDALAAQRVEQLLQQADLPVGFTSLGGLLDVAGIKTSQKRAFVEKFAATNSAGQAFWEELARDGVLDDAAIDAVQLAVQLGTLTQNNVALMKSLQQQLGRSGQGLRGLAGRSEAAWLSEIRQHTDQNGQVLLPPDVPVVDGLSAEESYARTMMRQVEATYPTPSVASALGRNDFAGAAGVRAFLNQHRDAEFRDQNLRLFLQDNNISLSAADRESLFAFKRIFDLAPAVDRYNAMRPLLQDGITSAYAIRRMGEKKFLARYAQALGPDVARRVYGAASQKTAVATALFAANSPVVNNLGLHVLRDGDLGALASQGSQSPGIDLPTWESLFGSISFCTCEHCRSVYSPAAYLVDLLAFLRQQETGGKTALQVLFARRGDIGMIELNCHNTNTTLPYVDLVVEVLEHFLAHEAVSSGTPWWEAMAVPQTVGEGGDLRVHPENIVAAAYGLLQAADYPWTLPFNLWAAEMRAYLQPLGATRAEIMRLLHPHPAAALPEAVRNTIAAETLGLIRREWRIILGQEAGGLAGWGNEPIDELRQVRTLMNRGRLSYAEVRRLLDTRFINRNGTLAVEFADDLCDIQGATIPALAEQPDAGRIHRFMRLQRRLGWDIYDLDAAIRVLGGGSLNAAFLRRLAVVKQLHDGLGTPILTLLSWWGPIDTTRRHNDADEAQPALYDRLFLNRSIGDQDDVQRFVLNSSLDELAVANQTLGQGRAAILAALNLITAEELDLIVQKRGIDGRLNLANLSELYRVATMAKALGLSVADLLALVDLIGFDPFTLANLEDIWRELLDVLAVIDASDFTIPELSYILNHDFAADSIYATGDAAIGDFLFKLRTGLKKLKAAYPRVEDPGQPGTMTVAPDPTGERTRLLLAQVVPEAVLERAMAVIAGTPDAQLPGGTQEPLDRNAIVDEHFATFVDNLPALQDRLVDEGSGSYLDPNSALAERFHAVLLPLTNHLLSAHSVALLQESFADHLDIDLRASDQLLGGLIKATADPAQPAGAIFLDDAFVDSDQDPLDEAAFGAQYPMVRRLQKIALLLNRFDIPSAEVRWLVEKSPQVGWLDLNTLPVSAQPADPTRFQAWVRMARFFWLRRQLPANEPSLFALLRMAHTGQDESGNPLDRAQFVAQLHAATGWNQADIDTLLDANHFNLAFNSQFTGPQALDHLLRLHHVVRLLQRLGVPAGQAWTWAAADTTREIAAEVKQAARAKFAAEQWPSVAEPIRDALRLQQRDALVDAALEIAHADGIEEIADLYAYFLMDVEMNPCMLTSRIKQAISSVQLFVQRCLMNLEGEVALDTDTAAQWQWMKNYRVWEANRKIFLYPENWIEPELRPEKSPFFADLENELLQNDVTAETVETAFLNYLEKLDEVARLEVASIYNDEENGGTLYVLGRTRGIPHKYFLRRWEKRRRWTPWEPVPVDIEGENVALTRYNRRLYLFWFMIQEKADDSDNATSRVPGVSNTGSDDFEPTRPHKYLEIKLAWSQYRNGKWAAKMLSEVAVRTEPNPFTLRQRAFSPRPLTKAGTVDLLVAVEQSENPLVSNRLMSVLESAVIEGMPTFRFGTEGRITLTFLEGPQDRDIVLDLPARDKDDGNYQEKLPTQGNLYIRSRGSNYVRVLGDAPPYRMLAPGQYTDFVSQAPLFYEDPDRNYLIIPLNRFRPDVPDLIDAHPGLVLDGRFVDGRLPEPDEPAGRPPLGGTGGIGPSFNTGGLDPALRDLVLPGPGIVGGVNSIRRPPLRADRLEATNVLGTNLANRLVGTPVPGDPAGLLGGLAVLLNAASQPAAAASTGNDPQPFVLDSGALLNADLVLAIGTTNRPAVALTLSGARYRFLVFYHPYVDYLIRQLNQRGIDGLLNPLETGEMKELRRQQEREAPGEAFDRVYELSSHVDKASLPVEEFDFSYTGAYALYNWELFFHAPLLIAARLGANQQFAAAQKWFHYIFDPTDVSDLPAADAPYRYWKIKPFFENRGLENIRSLLELLSSNDPQNQARREALEAQIADWRDNAFQPHRLAEQRLVAYQKATVMKYLDNLIAWGDHLFRRDTIESINEATQLYVLAAQILGKRPEALPEPQGERTIGGTVVKTFADLAQHLDQFGNVLVQIENETSLAVDSPELPDAEAPAADILGSTLFFCVPRNDKLLQYWDTIADRLFKIRNCMNIEGVVRQLSLFEPPIDPGALVRATAAGIDIGSVLNNMRAPRLQYRYSILVQRALELCSDVRQLGGALLAALEKRDAEEMALLRSSHEARLLQAVRDVRRLQLQDAEASLAGLEKNLEAAQDRYRFHAERTRRLSEENAQLSRLERANELELGIAAISVIKQALALTPRYSVGGSGFGGSPHIVVQTGLDNLVIGLDAASLNASALAQWANRASNMSAITASFQRRDEEWDFQAEQAATDIEALEKQIEGARLRIAIAEHELENHELQIQQSREVDEFMRLKFTNRELYSWMVAQSSTIYFQSYQLAYDMAMRAQRAFQYELADYQASFVDFGYWDNLKKGLLAGEQLHYDLRRMEVAYLEANRREYELTKHISLRQLNPAALVQLRETGSCEIDIPEVLFDLDYPGHFVRRIKAVSLTIPCVTGPYTTVNCTLTLLNNRVRASTERPGDAYGGFDDERFVTNVGGDQSIATSTARDDSGLFEFNFRDERYLPFEGAGATGRWRLELPAQYRQFDYDTIADVVLHMRYTARDGGAGFRTAVAQQVDARVNELVEALSQRGVFHVIDLKHEHGTALYRLLNPAGAADHAAAITLSKRHLPFLFQGKAIDVQNVIVFLKLRDAALYSNSNPLMLTISRAGGAELSQPLATAGSQLGGLAHATYAQLSGEITADEDWLFTVRDSDVQTLPPALRQTVAIDGSTRERIKAEEIENIGILLQVEIS